MNENNMATIALRIVDDNGITSELDGSNAKQVASDIAGTINTQISSFGGAGAVRDLLIQTLGEEMYERLTRDLANNIVQSLLA